MPQDQWKQKKSVIHHYNRLAKIYDALYGEEQKAKIESILQMMKNERKDLVLDLGCGTGLLIDYVAPKVNHLVGLDIAEKALKMASERSRRLRIKQNVSLIKADVDVLPFRDDIFDKIFALTILQNVPEPCKTIHEIVRVAKNSAEIAVTGLKKHFTKEKFSKMIRKVGLKYILAEPSKIHDLIAIVKVDKVKNK